MYMKVEISNYSPWAGAVDTYNAIEKADKLDDLWAYLEEIFPDYPTETEINDMLWFDPEMVFEALGMDDPEEEEE